MKKAMEALGKAIGWLLAIILCIIIFVGMFDIVVGIFELAYWLITGDCFHFINTESINTF